jgi:hypothetical protein
MIFLGGPAESCRGNTCAIINYGCIQGNCSKEKKIKGRKRETGISYLDTDLIGLRDPRQTHQLNDGDVIAGQVIYQEHLA